MALIRCHLCCIGIWPLILLVCLILVEFFGTSLLSLLLRWYFWYHIYITISFRVIWITKSFGVICIDFVHFDCLHRHFPMFDFSINGAWPVLTRWPPSSLLSSHCHIAVTTLNATDVNYHIQHFIVWKGSWFLLFTHFGVQSCSGFFWWTVKKCVNVSRDEIWQISA